MIEIITIGDELLIGQVTDTNSAWMAVELNKAGYRISQISTVTDKGDAIRRALELALSRSEVVLLTGGLGPTKDDITKTTLAEFFNSRLVFDESVYQNIERLFSNRSLPINELTRLQAMVPENCEVIQNLVGTAPVLLFEQEGKMVVSMPGVPFEMKKSMTEEIIPRIRSRFKGQSVLNKTVQVTGYGESLLAMKIEEWEAALPEHISLAYLPSLGVVKLRLSGAHDNGSELDKEIDRLFEQLESLLGNAIFAKNDLSVEENLGLLLRNAGLTISTAESCTGGNIAHRITTIAGSSDYFTGSVTAYQNSIKEQVLGVSPELIDKFGAVSEAVVEVMATGVKQLMDTDISIAVSGIAGPGGGTDEKPVGTTWIAVSCRDKTVSKLFRFGNYPRDILIERSSTAAMLMAIDLIRENAPKSGKIGA